MGNFYQTCFVVAVNLTYWQSPSKWGRGYLCLNWLNQCSFIISYCSQMGSFADSNLVSPRFKSKPKDWLAWGFTWFSSITPATCLDNILFAHPFDSLFTSHLAILYYKVRTIDIVIKSFDPVKLLWCSIPTKNCMHWL